jgi:TonB family protein
MILSTLLNGLWQGAPIVAVAYLLSRTLSRQNATTRCALWFTTLVALVVVPILATVSNAGAHFLDLFRAYPAVTRYTVSLIPTGAFVEHAGAWFARADTWILVAWLAGVAVSLARLGISFVRIERIRRNARPLANADSDIFVSDDVTVPIVAGIVAPAIVIPRALLSDLTPTDLANIVQHERAHVRRNDPLLNLVACLIEACLFFNPWVRLAGNQLSNEREAACDDWVVEKTGRADEYAACLAALAQTVRSDVAPLLTPSAFRSRHALVSRIERLSSSEPRRLNVNPCALGGLIVIFFIVTLVLQAFSPALALTPDAQTSLRSLPASSLAAACTKPNAEATVINPVAPVPPHGLHVHGKVNVAVTIASNGLVTGAKVLYSSGYPAMDQAVVTAARQSTYSPKIVSCAPVTGSYIFTAEFAPN